MTMDMARAKKMVSLALDPNLLKQVDEWLAKQKFPTTKTAVFETSLRDFLKKYGKPNEQEATEHPPTSKARRGK